VLHNHVRIVKITVINLETRLVSKTDVLNHSVYIADSRQVLKLQISRDFK